MEKEEIIAWKTKAWQAADFAALYQKQVASDQYTNRLKNEIEVGLCLRYAKGKKVLDAGIGTGRAGIPLARRGFDVLGIDSSEAMLEECSRQAGDTRLDLQCADIINSELPEAAFDTVLSLNFVMHFPVWRDLVKKFVNATVEGGRIIFDIGSADNVERASRVLGLQLPVEAKTPNEYQARASSEEIVDLANSCGVTIHAVIPYAGVLGGGNINYWLHSSLASGFRYERMLSWCSVDDKLYNFLRFIEQDILEHLTPAVAARMMVILEKTTAPKANEQWLGKMKLIDEMLAQPPIEYERASRIITAWDAVWRRQLNMHLEWPRNRVLFHFLLSNFPGFVALETFVDEKHAKAVIDWQKRLVYDLLTKKILQHFYSDADYLPLDADGVNLRAGLEYTLTKKILQDYFHAFD